jgi:hypothetical protein
MSCNSLHHSCVCRTEALMDLLETVEKMDRFIREAGNKTPSWGRARADFGISQDSVQSLIRRTKKIC